jgi:glycosyltransferase involved in cell wall biosynthesis
MVQKVISNNRKVRVLHVAALARESPGIQLQLNLEDNAAKTLGINWNSRVILPEPMKGKFSNSKIAPINTFLRFTNWWKHRVNVYSSLLESSDSYDILILRYSVHDPFLLWFLFTSTKPVLLVHHTIEFKELLLEGKIIGTIRATLEKVIGKLVNRKATGQLAVTEQILESVLAVSPNSRFSRVYSNGIEIEELKNKDSKGITPEFLFVSSVFHSWQGLDRLIAAMRTNKENFKIHLVGSLDSEQELACTQDSRFTIHGTLDKFEIEEIAASCWAGIGPLAIDRKGLSQGSALKVREYLSMGLPVIADHDDVFPIDWPFFKKIDTSPQRLIIEMLEYASGFSKYSKHFVQKSSINYISKKELVRDLYEALISSQLIRTTSVEQSKR